MEIKKILKKYKEEHSNVARAVSEDALFQIGSRAELARLRAGITQSELAKRLGTKQSAIARIENGSTNISVGMLQKIAEALGTHLILPEFASIVNVDLEPVEMSTEPAPYQAQRTTLVGERGGRLDTTEASNSEKLISKNSFSYA